MHIREAKRTLGTTIPWLCDPMDNRIKHGLGNAPNSEFVIDPQGKLVRKRVWSDPDQLRKDLVKLVGPVAHPTRASDIKLKTVPPPKMAASGVVKRIERPRSMQVLKVTPKIDGNRQPFYVKLRAEAERSLLGSGGGKLYLGFRLDPLYHVHWNNLTKPVRVEIQPPRGVTVTPATLNGPKVKPAADIDPREFLVDVKGKQTSEPIHVVVRYFACNDEQKWCKAVQQEYDIVLTSDPDGGRTLRGGFGRRGGRAGMAGRRGRFGRPGFAGMSFVTGRIAKIDLKTRTVSVRTRDGKTQTFRVSNETRMMRNRQRGRLGDFQAGDRCRLMYKPSTKQGETPVLRGLMARSRR